MGNNIVFDEMKINDINNVSNMVNNVFDEFVGIDYSDNGKKTFKDYITPQNILERFNNETSKFYVAKYIDEIIGILEIKNKDHISLFFVKKEYHGKGTGKKLFDNYIRTLKQDNNGIKVITVNSSFFAENIYSKMGFIKIDEIQERDGIKYIPMEYKLMGEAFVEKIKEKALKLANKKIAFVGSVSENNAPNIKAMLVAKHDGLKTFYFASNNSALRTEQYKHNSNACIYFNGGIIYKGIMLEGIMEIINDIDIKKLVWNNNYKSVYKNGGINDPDYCVLKFTAKKGRYYYWFKTETFEI